jgi:ubiquinone/menaquinone biosynthesis C-methylase UbiE
MDSQVQRNKDQGTFFLKHKWNKEESLRAQREDQMLTRAMGGPLTEQVDANTFEQPLHIACGSGNWTIEAARRYPQLSLVGIDTNPHILDFARANAAAAHVEGRVRFQVMDALRALDFPAGSFDLVNLRLGVTFIRTWEWPELIVKILRVTRPGGIIRITEPQIRHQNKGSASIPGITKLHTALICALYRSGHLFEEDTTGITAHLAPLLTRFGCQTHWAVLAYCPSDVYRLLCPSMVYRP